MPTLPSCNPTLLSRRDALRHVVAAAAAIGLAGPLEAAATAAPANQITLAQWSLHRAIFAGELDPLDFPRAARAHGIGGIEFVNQFYQRYRSSHQPASAPSSGATSWITALRRQADAEGVRCHLIMCDGEGELGNPDANARRSAVESHRHWLDIAKELGCHAIRVNAFSNGSPDEQRGPLADGLGSLADRAAELGLQVVVENHGAQSSDGVWLAEVLRATRRPNLGALPDFGNFRKTSTDWADRYAGVEALAPIAFAMSAKSFDFDPAGNETTIDYPRMMSILRTAGYAGPIGIEYEGRRLSEADGIARTKRLLERLGCRS
jgi:L-ribulose-5-phosphate 3-epimerase